MKLDIDLFIKFFIVFINFQSNIKCVLYLLIEETSWVGSDRDYTYDELLVRVFNIMREKNPDMVAGKKQKFVMRPPQVVRIGTKKTSFANFTEVSCIVILVYSIYQTVNPFIITYLLTF